MINNKRVLAVIPARSGSKGVPGKNIRYLGKEPLVAYIAYAAQKSRYIDRLIVSTNDEQTIEIAKSIGIDVPFVRPEEFAKDNSSLISVITHAYEFFKEKGEEYDGAISLQPTCPFIQSRTIDAMIEIWGQSGCQSVTAISEIVNGHPFIAKRFFADSNTIENFWPLPEGFLVGSRQNREKAYYLTGGAFLRNKALVEKGEKKGHCLGEESKAVVVSQLEAVDINSEIDFLFAEFLINSGRIKDNGNLAL